jgi:hypothetical protein
VIEWQWGTTAIQVIYNLENRAKAENRIARQPLIISFASWHYGPRLKQPLQPPSVTLSFFEIFLHHFVVFWAL